LRYFPNWKCKVTPDYFIFAVFQAKKFKISSTDGTSIREMCPGNLKNILLWMTRAEGELHPTIKKTYYSG